MRKAQKQEILGLIGSLHQIHEEIKKTLEQKNLILAQDMLSGAQESAISIGEKIEKSEGEGHVTVFCIEEYCELLFRVYEDISKKDFNANKVYKTLRKQLIKIENSVKNDIAVRKEIAFFPYKASMWDSLESIYLAAREDPDCDAYCVPIPYYTLNPDQSFGEMHYEGNEYPKEIEITKWQEYDFEERRPDVMYIHNPYDDCNLVTSVHPRFYSANLKKYTDCLVYVPYYSTSGGMSEAQSLCPAYIHADYIVIQSPEFRKYFDANIPDEKFLPFGSPKFDRIIKKCQNPPEPPAEWKERMVGRKVYFYNTSIAGMLADTETFLKKMNYVFECFEGREDACLLWRPHPLLENTFDSMRPQYRQIYDALKQMFLDKKLGILDTSPDMADAIASSDAYIGDEGTSVISLFGVVGKPIFILNNRIHSEPEESDWRREIVIGFNTREKERFAVAQGNRLYISEPYKYEYKYFCDLPENVRDGNHYLILEIGSKLYVCNLYTQDIFVIGECGIEEKIELDRKIEQGRAFAGGWKFDEYLILIPSDYPAIVCYDTATKKIAYFEQNISVFVTEEENQRMTGGTVIRQGIMYIASLKDNRIFKMHIESGEAEIIDLPIRSRNGFAILMEYKNDLWGIPYSGRTIIRWNPDSGETREYVLDMPKQFTCIHPTYGYQCEKIPFDIPIFYGQYLYLPPYWSNMYLKLNIETGELGQWRPSYISAGEIEQCCFILSDKENNGSEFMLYSYVRQKLYSINMDTEECKEIEVRFDMEEFKRHERGFSEYMGGSKYMCKENVFNSLPCFLGGNITGGQFDKERQLAIYMKTGADSDGRCGDKIHQFIKKISQEY